MLDFVLAENVWLPASLSVAFACVAYLHWRGGRTAWSTRQRILAAMNVFFGCLIGVMAGGHLVAVTIHAARGTLRGSLAWLLLLGLVLAVPAWVLALRSARLVEARNGPTKLTLLNGWLGLSLLAFGLHNVPMAVPAALNIGYQFHTRRAVGWTLVAMYLAATLFLFVGSLIFLASGQSFEEFRGLR